jgi:hypothetical protein
MGEVKPPRCITESQRLEVLEKKVEEMSREIEILKIEIKRKATKVIRFT